MNIRNKHTWWPAVGAAALLLAVTGCDRNDGRAASQSSNETVAQADRKVEEVKRDTRSATNEVTSTVSGKVKDASITTAVNAQLARDDKLSAIKIDVDTQDGRVRLSGTAPDAVSRDRASTLAQGIDGVVSVDNQLTVTAR